MIRINISKEFSSMPGGRYVKEGPYSGEAFRNEILIPKYLEAKKTNDILLINFDDCYGFPTSFLEEAFGGLVRLHKDENMLEIMKFISEDEPTLIESIKEYINDELKRG